MGAAFRSFMGSVHTAVARATVGRPIVYRLFVEELFDPDDGVKRPIFYDVPIPDATRPDVTEEELRAEASALQTGDVAFSFAANALAAEVFHAQAGGVSTSDRILDEGEEYRVVLARERAGAVLRVFARR